MPLLRLACLLLSLPLPVAAADLDPLQSLGRALFFDPALSISGTQSCASCHQPDNGFAYALEPDGRGARVMQSAPVLLPAFDAASPDVKKISERLNPQLSENVLTSYLAQLQAEAGVKVNETLWRNISGQQTN